jgi:DNA polymerase family B
MMIISDRQHRLLLKVLTICYFVPDIPHPIRIPYGEQGSCKSTFSEFQKRLIDPSKTNLLTIPKDKSEFVQQLHHNYLVASDNTRYLPPWFSDEVCKAVTGVGNTKRKLYSDDEDIIVNYRRCMIINGINNNLTEPDALDRSILIEFERIPKELRKEESKIEIQFEEIRPKLLGYIFNVLVKAIRIKADLELTHLPRMADFAVWGEAISRAMGYKPMEFIDVYNKNIGRQNIELIESNQLAQTIEKFVQSWCIDGSEACWTSSTSKVLYHLNRIAQQYNIDTSGRDWPRASNSLTKRPRPLLTNLREGLGIHIILGRTTTGSNKNKNISIIKIWKESPLSPLPPPVQDHPLNLSQSSGGSIVSGDCASAEQYVSPLQIGQNHAQNLESGGSGDSGGYVSNLVITDASSYSNVLPDKYVAFDFEWSTQADRLPTQITSADTPIQIIAAAFVDNLGNNTVLHITDFYDSDNPEYELLLNIVQKLTKYEYSIGWYSTGAAVYHEDTQEYLDGVDSDLIVLHSRCMANGLDSIINISSGTPYINGQTHIDLYSVFSKTMIQTTIFKNAYRTLKLDEVSRVVLKSNNDEGGGNAGKYKKLTGRDIPNLPVEEQKAYVLRDAELVMQLSKHNNSEVLDAMKALAEITGLDFERVCRSGISTWWAAIYDQAIINGESQLRYYHSNTDTSVQEYEYKGAIVLEPKRGIYHDLVVVDVVSLYPSMVVLHNISFDTINCECCRDNLEARIPEQISMLLNSNLDSRNDKRDYWICKRSEGVFPRKLRLFKEERIRQKELGNSVKQLALKILINGGYGVFGSRFFKYRDLRVAELITAYGR